MHISKRLTTDGVVTEQAGILTGILLTSDGVGATSVVVHDGRDASAPILCTVRTPTNTTTQINYFGKRVFTGGLYVNVGANIGEVIVEYEPEHFDSNR